MGTHLFHKFADPNGYMIELSTLKDTNMNMRTITETLRYTQILVY